MLRVYLAISWSSRSLWVSTPGVGINFCPRLSVLRAAALKGLLLRLKTPFNGRAGGPVGCSCRRCLCACSRLRRLCALLRRLGLGAVAVAAGGAVGLGAAAAVAAVGCCASVQPAAEALGRLGHGVGAAADHGEAGVAAAAAALACCGAVVLPARLQAACYGAWAVVMWEGGAAASRVAGCVSGWL